MLSKIKISIFTTLTVHHTWFVSQLVKVCPNMLCFVEDNLNKHQKIVLHSYEQNRDNYESQYFFQSRVPLISSITQTYFVNSVNQRDIVDIVKNFHTDIIIVFGTNKIKGEIIKNYEGKIINLHGGDPEYYRGLDSHLWAIYHNDFDSIVTTLHVLNDVLDDGYIIQKHQLNLQSITDISQLRALNTKACLDLCIGALYFYANNNYFINSKQRNIGRYYSTIPFELKDICCKNFQKYLFKHGNRNIPKSII